MADDVSDKKDKTFDEQTLAKVLEAAFVLQEHHRELKELGLRVDHKAPVEEPTKPVASGPLASPRRATAAQDDYTGVLAQIVETQHQIQTRHLDLEATLSLIVARVAETTRAAGASIGLLENKTLRYRAVAGRITPPVGTEVPAERALCSASLQTGDVIRCADVNPAFRSDAAECHRWGIQSLISVPIYHDGKIAGALEVYYANPHAFSEPDVHTCQLMAGLVTEGLSRSEQLTSKTSIANERAVMREALEKLKPNLAALVDSTARKQSGTPAPTKPQAPASVFPCRRCGHELLGEEQFCRQCGTPRSRDYGPPSLQSKVASMFYMQDAVKKNVNRSSSNGSSPQAQASLDVSHLHSGGMPDDAKDDLPGFFRLPESPPAEGLEIEALDEQDAFLHTTGNLGSTDCSPEDEGGVEWEQEPSTETALVKAEPSANWSSAAATREFLEQVATDKPAGKLVRFLSSRRGDLYLALAVILVALAIRWGVWSNPAVGTGNTVAAASHRKPDANVSAFDRLLIKLGLAEAPDTPEDKGNPNIQVWVDLHTALYYCPGSELYAKTPKGKFASQEEAQMDQYEPANRKVCN